MIDLERKVLYGRAVRDPGELGAFTTLFGSCFVLGLGAIGTACAVSFGLSGTGGPAFSAVLSASLIFLNAGITGFREGLRKRSDVKRKERTLKEFPDRPWESDCEWDKYEAKVNHTKEGLEQLFILRYFALLLLPFNYWAWVAIAPSSMALCVLGILDLLLLVKIFRASYRIAQGVKYGTSHLKFERFPYSIGEALDVKFSTLRPIGEFRNAKLTCRCIEEETIEQNGKRIKSCVQIFAEEIEIDEPGNMGTEELPIFFSIPADQPGTSLVKPPLRYWELEIKAQTTGVNFEALFPLPIYVKPTAS